MNDKLSPEAARAKYEYNKKYQKRYWERRAAKQVESGHHAQNKQAEVEGVSVSRNRRTDQQYIDALETSNRTLNRENRRLVKLLHSYQNLIAQAIVAR